MAEYKINLIRDRVLAKPFRKFLFWGMLGYLVLCGVVLAFVVHKSALGFVGASRGYREIKVVEEQFMLTHPDAKDLLSYAGELRPRMVANANILAEIDKGLNLHLDFASILLGVAKPLPDGCVLVNFDFNRKNGVIKFDVLTPISGVGSCQAGALIELWKADGRACVHLGNIRSESSRREFRAGRAVKIHSFEAEVGG